MNGICLVWSRGRLISPSLPIGDDRYLNLSSQKRPTGRNLGGNRLVRRSGTTSRGTVALVFCLRMRSFPLTLVHTIFVGMKWIDRFANTGGHFDFYCFEKHYGMPRGQINMYLPPEHPIIVNCNNRNQNGCRICKTVYCVWSSEYTEVFTSYTRASFLNMRVDLSSNCLIRNRPFCNYFALL